MDVLSMPEVFRCERRQMTLTDAGCNRLFLSANKLRAPDPWEGRAACRNCSLGSQKLTGHKPDPFLSVLLDLKNICSRCGNESDRMVWGIYCASCDARQREAIRGRNSKGSMPALASRLHPIRLAGTIAGVSRIIYKAAVISIPEVMIQVGKTAAGPSTFGRRRVFWDAMVSNGRSWSTQLELGI